MKSLPKLQDLNRGEKEQGMRRMKRTPGTRTSWHEAQEMRQEIHQVHPLGDRDKKLQEVPKCRGWGRQSKRVVILTKPPMVDGRSTLGRGVGGESGPETTSGEFTNVQIKQ